MFKSIIPAILFMLMANFCMAQITLKGVEPAPISLADPAFVEVAKPDLQQLAAEDLINDLRKDKPWRFGVKNEVYIDPFKEGSWTEGLDGKSIWTLDIKAPGAMTISYLFRDFHLPPSVRLFVIDRKTGKHSGAITADNNNELNVCSTWPLEGSHHLLQLEVAASEKNSIKLVLKEIIYGYRNFKDTDGIGDSGECNINVNCPEGAPWLKQKRAVVMIVVGSTGHCTGTLINNTLNNGRPYVLTGSHCLSGTSADSWNFRFNFESSECANDTYTGSVQSVTGAKVRARDSSADVLLVEMITAPPLAYNPFFAGWDYSDEIPQKQFDIHHPRGDLKKISFNENAAIKAPYMDDPTDNPCWKVDAWDKGTTENASSGSALFDFNGRIIGHLIGGHADCQNPDKPDYFGRLAYDFGTGDSTVSLDHWLNPSSTNTKFIDGYDPLGPQANVDAALGGLTAESQKICSNIIKPEMILYNNGMQDLVSATLKLTIDGGATYTKGWTGNLRKGESTVVVFDQLTLPSGEHSLHFELVNPNNTNDEFLLNNTGDHKIRTFEGGLTHTMRIVLDDFGTENYWRIENDQQEVFASGGPYTDNNKGKVITQSICLSPGCYKLHFIDVFGDGMCCSFGNGSYALIESRGDTLAKGWRTPPEQQVLVTETTDFCIKSVGIQPGPGLSGLRIGPNPAHDMLNIYQDSAAKLEVTVVNALGALVERTVFHNAANQMDISTYIPGIYFVRMKPASGEEQVTRVLVLPYQ